MPRSGTRALDLGQKTAVQTGDFRTWRAPKNSWRTRKFGCFNVLAVCCAVSVAALRFLPSRMGSVTARRRLRWETCTGITESCEQVGMLLNVLTVRGFFCGGGGFFRHWCCRCCRAGRASTGEERPASGTTSPPSLSTIKTKTKTKVPAQMLVVSVIAHQSPGEGGTQARNFHFAALPQDSSRERRLLTSKAPKSSESWPAEISPKP